MTTPTTPQSPSPIGNPDLFPVLRRWHFFNHAGVSPLPRPAADAVRRFTHEAETGSYLDTNWFADLELLRKSAATLINAAPDEIAFTKNTAEGLATVARGLDFAPGDRIVTTGVEYPANIYPWMDLQKYQGVQLDLVAEESTPTGQRLVPLDKLLAAASHPRTRLLTVSHVEFASGQRHDLATIGQFCRQRGILFCVDAIQSLGAIPADVRAMNVDFLAAGSQKWLLGPLGAGIFFCRKELLPKVRPLIVGSANVVDAMNFGHYDYTLRPDAARFESGGSPIASLLGLRASLDLLLSVGIDAISQRLQQATTRLADALTDKGYRIVSPRDRDAWSGILSFIAPGREREHQAIVQSLRKERRIEIALREGRLRASPHFYIPDWQLDDLIGALPDVA